MKKDRWKYISFRENIYVLVSFLCIIFLQTLSTIGWITGKIYFIYIFFGYLFILGLVSYYYFFVYLPQKEMKHGLELFYRGYTVQGIFDFPYSLSPEVEKALYRFKDMINTNELVSASKKQAEYLALQNQINPHFLYNTLEGIRGETLIAGLDHVAKMTEALATFFRYTISKVDHLVTLEDELKNIENYYIIQQYRFGNKLNLKVQIEDEEQLLKYHMPKLTLQPIVENSIYHGIERKIGQGNLRIKAQATKKRLIITISDDGLGMSRERLQEVNDKLYGMYMGDTCTEESKGGIALVNVNSRIKLLFGEEYGICIYSIVNSGTDVEITLPLIGDEEKKDYGRSIKARTYHKETGKTNSIK